MKGDAYFSKYVNWIRGEYGPNSVQAKTLPKRFRGGKGGSGTSKPKDPSK